MNADMQVLGDYIKKEMGYEGEIDQETDLISAGILDSFSIVQIAVFIQDQFGIELEAEDLVRANLSKLSSMEALIAKRRKAP